MGCWCQVKAKACVTLKQELPGLPEATVALAGQCYDVVLGVIPGGPGQHLLLKFL